MGEYAHTPYYLNNICINVFSIEEVCYLLALNPFMIDATIMDEKLIDWIENECKIKELADALRPLLKRGSSVSEFVGTILSYVNYCDKEEEELVYETLRSASGLSDMARKKRQADFLLKSGRYEGAISEYEALLSSLEETQSDLKPKIYRNMGYAYARLFMFDVSSKYYKRAFDMTKDPEIAVQYLAAVRLNLSDEKYINFMSEHTFMHEASMELEKKLNDVMGSFEGSQENIMLNALKIYKDEGNVASYYDEIDKVIAGLKEDYLKQALD